MTAQKLLVSITILSLLQVKAIWPPAYKINLTHEETFVISEVLSSDDTDDIYQAEDEMIKESELKSFDIQSDSQKYSRLHQLVVRRNSENVKIDTVDYNKKRLIKPVETNYELDETPWESGFVDKHGHIKPDTKIVYNENEAVDTATKSNKKDTIRKVSTEKREYENYDYNALKNEYDSNIKNVKVSNETLNYTEPKEEESFKDAIKTVVENSKKRNCTVEERKGIGLAAAECLWVDLMQPQTTEKKRSQIFHRIGTIIMIWILVYLLVAIPCWCQRVFEDLINLV